jgi:hypothetical protein
LLYTKRNNICPMPVTVNNATIVHIHNNILLCIWVSFI